MMYAQGKDVDRDPHKAVQWFLRLADQGNADAMFMLGSLHDEDLNDPSAAAGWYRRAAEKGYAPAQYNLALLHQAAEGALRDAAQARRWYEACIGASSDAALVENARRGIAALI